MKKQIYLLLTCVALYFIVSAALQVAYGPSYGWFEGEDRWEPDGQGGWVARGNPTKPMPNEPSVIIPILLLYLPVFIPGALLVLFLFTPLSRKLDPPRKPDPESDPDPPADGKPV